MKNVFSLIIAILCFSAPITAQIKTITNADLAKYRRERLKNDPDDENERARLGLPSRAEEQIARERRAAEIGEFAARIREQQAEAENYWQAQAFDLRSEIAAVEAEIRYVRARVGAIPAGQTYYAIGYNPYFYTPGCCANSYFRGASRGIQIGGRIPPPGKRLQVSIGANHSRNSLRNTGKIEINRNSIIQNSLIGKSERRFGNNLGTLVVPFTLPTYENLTREELVAELRALEQRRAGLYARFAVLEDEARRAGVKID